MLLAIWLAVVLSFSLYCLSTYIKPLENGRDPRTLLVGILGLIFALLHLRAIYSLVFMHLPHPAILFRIVRAIVNGTWATILVSMGFQQGARNMLILAGILFAAAPLSLGIVLRQTAPGVTLHSILTSAKFYSLEAWPVGIAIPATILLLRKGKSGNNTFGHDRTAHTAEEETEA
jgi:hypothetical protein